MNKKWKSGCDLRSWLYVTQHRHGLLLHTLFQDLSRKSQQTSNSTPSLQVRLLKTATSRILPTSFTRSRNHNDDDDDDDNDTLHIIQSVLQWKYFKHTLEQVQDLPGLSTGNYLMIPRQLYIPFTVATWQDEDVQRNGKVWESYIRWTSWFTQQYFCFMFRTPAILTKDFQRYPKNFHANAATVP